MKKLLLVLSLVSILMVSVFATVNLADINWTIDSDLKISRTVSVKVYQWIYASVSSNKTIEITKPGSESFDLFNIAVGSNKGATLRVEMTGLPNQLALEGMYVKYDGTNDSVPLVNDKLDLSDDLVLPGYNADTGTVTFKDMVFGAKFNASPILIANKDNPYTITVNFTFEPSIKFTNTL